MIERQEKKSPRARGGARAGRVIRVYKDAAGMPVCDVTDLYGGTHIGCKFTGFGGGAESFDYAPTKAPDSTILTPEIGSGSEVLLVFPDGYTTRPWVLAALPHPRLAKRIKALPVPAATEDYPEASDEAGLNDRVIEHLGVRVILSPAGGVVIDSRRARLPVRVQLAAGQAMRVSVAGEAQEHLVLAGPLKAYLDSLAARVNAIGALAHQIERWAQQIPTGAIEVDGVPKPVSTIDRYTGALQLVEVQP